MHLHICTLYRHLLRPPFHPLTKASFAPLTIMTGIYGMNVSEFSGNKENPDIWQFFVAVIAMNFVMVMILASYNLISIHYQHGRIAGIREIVGFAVGRTPNAPQQK